MKFTAKNTSATLSKMSAASVASIPHEKELAGFKRIELAPGHSQQVTIHVGARELSSWSTIVHDWVRNPGTPAVYVGSSSRDLRLMTSPIFTYVYLPLVMR